jgi:hypothetical protein
MAKSNKNKQFSSWPGLTTDAVRHHFPDLDKTHKGHGRLTPSRLRLTKQTQAAAHPEEQDKDKNIIATKQKTIFFQSLRPCKRRLTQNMDRPDQRFPKQSSHGNQYILVLTKSDSSAILVDP